MTPVASVAMLEKLALLKIALCRAPAFRSTSSACFGMASPVLSETRIRVLVPSSPRVKVVLPIIMLVAPGGSITRTQSYRSEQRFNRALQLKSGVRLLKEVRAVNKQRLHLIVDGIAGRIKHRQIQPELDGLLGNLTAAKHGFLEVDIGKKRINLLRRTQEQKRLVNVAGRKDIVAPASNHRLRVVAEKPIIFYDQNHGHENHFCRDNQNRDYPSSSCRESRLSEPFRALSGLRDTHTGAKGSVDLDKILHIKRSLGNMP